MNRFFGIGLLLDEHSQSAVADGVTLNGQRTAREKISDDGEAQLRKFRRRSPVPRTRRWYGTVESRAAKCQVCHVEHEMNCNGKDVPPELRELPAGRNSHGDEAPALTPAEEAGIEAALESYRQGRIVDSRRAREIIDAALAR